MENEKRHNSKRRLLLLILLLVCTLVLLGGSTYAWFTANTKVSIEELQLEVTTANGIEISGDAVHWGARITKADLYKSAGIDLDTGMSSQHEQAGSVNMFPEKLKNVSTIGNISDANRMEIFNGVASNACEVENEAFDENQAEDPITNPKTFIKGVESEDFTQAEGATTLEKCLPNGQFGLALVKTTPYTEGNTACKGSGENSGLCSGSIGVVAFDIYLKLDNNSVVSLANTSYVKNNSKTDLGLKNTIRVAFVTLGTQPSAFYFAPKENYDNTGVVQVYDDTIDANKQYAKTPAEGGFGGYAGKYGARNMNAFGNIVIWEPNSTSHTDSGLLNASKNYDRTVTGPDDTHGIHAIDGITLPMFLTDANPEANPEFFVAQDPDKAENDEDEDIRKNEVKYVPVASDTATTTPLFTAPAGVTKVRVYIWVEGQDIDTENNATSSNVAALLSFTTAETPDTGVNPSTYLTYTRTTVANNWNSWVVANNDTTDVNKPITGGAYTGS